MIRNRFDATATVDDAFLTARERGNENYLNRRCCCDRDRPRGKNSYRPVRQTRSLRLTFTRASRCQIRPSALLDRDRSCLQPIGRPPNLLEPFARLRGRRHVDANAIAPAPLLVVYCSKISYLSEAGTRENLNPKGAYR